MGGLTDKQKLFVDAYLECFNATEAARRAGYKGNENTLGSVGWENLQKPAISEVIKRRLSESAMSADEVLSRLAEIARGEHSSYIVEDGTVDIAQLVQDEKAHLIKGIRDTKEGRRYEFHDSLQALSLLGKHHKMFTDKVEHSGSVKVEQVTADDLASASKSAEDWEQEQYNDEQPEH